MLPNIYWVKNEHHSRWAGEFTPPPPQKKKLQAAFQLRKNEKNCPREIKYLKQLNQGS